MDWYMKVVFDNYANFKGRASRKEYWMFYLFNIIFAILALVADVTLGTGYGNLGEYGGLIYYIYMLAMIIPFWAVSIRRLHDTGRSGWFVFIFLIPLIGAIWYIFVLCTDSESGENKYGWSPKDVENFSGEEETQI